MSSSAMGKPSEWVNRPEVQCANATMRHEHAEWERLAAALKVASGLELPRADGLNSQDLKPFLRVPLIELAARFNVPGERDPLVIDPLVLAAQIVGAAQCLAFTQMDGR